MGKNERIIAQDLFEIKDAIQNNDQSKLDEFCKVLAKEMKRYPVKSDVADKLAKISMYSESSDSTIQEMIKEIEELINILLPNR